MPNPPTSNQATGSRRLPPIPIPLTRRWQDFRIQALPVFVCGGALILVAVLWKDQAAPRTATGEVEAMVSEVTSPGSGSIGQLYVTHFGEVEAGDLLAQVITTPPDVLHASLAVLKAEIELARLGWFDPLLDQQRNALQLESLKLDWLEKRAAAAIRAIELQQVERDYERVRKLHETRMVSDDEFERSQSRVAVLTETLRQERELAEEMEASLAGIRLRQGGNDFAPAAMKATLALQGERLSLMEAQLRPVTLWAPMSGVVTMIDRSQGEHVVAGGRILTIRATRPERIVTYLRQPLAVEPEVGMRVEVTTRGRSRQKALTEIAAIGPQMEPLGPAFARPMNPNYESGLPVVVNLPAGLRLRPGELVDVSLRP